ncbi:virion structural protein [Vibrio phage douglas 12A4]|uniref:virion structural protein n=1 Tax=Vibrio phage douglas 12A4 TaxID=573171 RepID=UPI0002C13B9C|nr:virion structural protein [Vibrio phage douglas 12A4]AGG58041.1 hypothetical protein VPAG_00005 [Vibrio phage douglas 12A4]
MADVKTALLGKAIYNGTHGNLSLAYNHTTFKSQASGSDMLMLDIPIGTRVTGLRLINEALGSSVTIQGFIRFDSDGSEIQLTPAIAASGAKTENHIFSPIMVADKGPAKLVVKVAGAAATGKLDAILEFMAVGY